MAWTRIGTIKKGDKGNYLQIAFPRDPKTKEPLMKEITLKEGQNLQVYNPRKNKFLTEEQIAKIPEFVLAEVFLPPEDGKKKPE